MQLAALFSLLKGYFIVKTNSFGLIFPLKDTKLETRVLIIIHLYNKIDVSDT